VANGNDWRVTISLTDPGHAGRAQHVISEQQVEQDVRRQLGHAVAVGAGDSEVFLYAGSEVAAREAERVARDLLAKHGIEAEFALHRWHPLEEQWEDAGVAMPSTEAERQAEHMRLEDSETAESRASGIAQWEARANFPSHHDAVAAASKLRSAGYAVVRRWKFLAVGANNQDDAERIADEIRREAPSDATVRAERSGSWLPFIPF
jgi:hypothetical protein